jgi:hypothetical protein
MPLKEQIVFGSTWKNAPFFVELLMEKGGIFVDL